MTLAEPAPRPAAVLGTGALGSAVAGALLAAGRPTTVWNRTAGRADRLVARGATPSATVADAVSGAEVVLVAVPTYDDVRSLLGPGTAGGAALRGRTLVNLTSGSPDQAVDAAAWAAETGAGYVDVAAMSGTRLVGSPDALFLAGGDADAFRSAEPTLSVLGRTLHLGTDPARVSLYDTALLGVNLALLGGFSQAVAVLGAAGVPAVDVADVVVGYLPFAVGLLADHARQVDEGRYPGDDGTLAVLRPAVGHLIDTARSLGVGTDLPAVLAHLLDRGISAGHGDDGVARLADVIAGGDARQRATVTAAAGAAAGPVR